MKYQVESIKAKEGHPNTWEVYDKDNTKFRLVYNGIEIIVSCETPDGYIDLSVVTLFEHIPDSVITVYDIIKATGNIFEWGIFGRREKEKENAISKAFENKYKTMFVIILRRIHMDTKIEGTINKIELYNLQNLKIHFSWRYPEYGLKFSQEIMFTMEFLIDAEDRVKDFLLYNIYKLMMCTLLENTKFKLSL